MFRASQREIVWTMAALCLTPRRPPAVRQGATSESCLPRTCCQSWTLAEDYSHSGLE